MIFNKLLENFDAEKFLTNGGAIDDVFTISSIKDRQLKLETEVCVESVSPIISLILEYNKADTGVDVEKRKPILLTICSDGGEVDAGFALIDAIQASKTPVYTIVTGYAFSMACIIAMAGTKRYAMKHSSFLIHDGFFETAGSLGQVADNTSYAHKMGELMREFIMEKTNITKKEINKRKRTEWFLPANEAKEKGIIDMIIGEDCELVEVA